MLRVVVGQRVARVSLAPAALGIFACNNCALNGSMIGGYAYTIAGTPLQFAVPYGSISNIGESPAFGRAPGTHQSADERSKATLKEYVADHGNAADELVRLTAKQCSCPVWLKSDFVRWIGVDALRRRAAG